MSVYIDVWHRTHPTTPANHERFLDYYGEFVVAPPSDFFEVVAGFKYVDGPSNEDFALYRYASMAAIEESMMTFGADPAFLEATETLFSEIEIEETRAIALHTPYAPEARLDAALAESSNSDPTAAAAHRFLRIQRTCSGTSRIPAFAALTELRDAIEKASEARLILAFHYIVGPVMDLVEIWRVPAGPLSAAGGWPDTGVDADLEAKVAGLAPARERRRLEPTEFSRLR